MQCCAAVCQLRYQRNLIKHVDNDVDVGFRCLCVNSPRAILDVIFTTGISNQILDYLKRCYEILKAFNYEPFWPIFASEIIIGQLLLTLTYYPYLLSYLCSWQVFNYE